MVFCIFVSLVIVWSFFLSSGFLFILPSWFGLLYQPGKMAMARQAGQSAETRAPNTLFPLHQKKSQERWNNKSTENVIKSMINFSWSKPVVNFINLFARPNFWEAILVLSQCKTTSAYEAPRSSGNDCTNFWTKPDYASKKKRGKKGKRGKGGKGTSLQTTITKWFPYI